MLTVTTRCTEYTRQSHHSYNMSTLFYSKHIQHTVCLAVELHDCVTVWVFSCLSHLLVVVAGNSRIMHGLAGRRREHTYIYYAYNCKNCNEDTTLTHTHTHTRTRTHTHTHTHTHTCTYTHTHTHTHTHTQTDRMAEYVAPFVERTTYMS